MLALVNTTGQRPRNLILIGFMGTGKTTIGKRVAKSLGFKFVDTDSLIEKKAGKPIVQIFKDSGEDAFRSLETEILKECGRKSGQVISTGGGIVTRPENLELLKEAGYVIWLKASPEIIFERVSRNRSRPLLQTGNPQKTIDDLLSKRAGLYAGAQHLSINTDELTMEETCFGVTESTKLALGID
ncbi:MAG: shikimate kinase [Verrucomicrobiales bacterium]|nr:shikimate kinase [Verrucomicrobiales bacterium]